MKALRPIALAVLAVLLLTGGSVRAAERPNPVNNLAFSLYGRMKSQPGNLVYSPFCISACLALAYEGARGATAAEMSRVLSFSSREQTRSFFSSTMGSMSGPRGAYRLTVANSLWLQKGFALANDYSRVVTGTYRAGVFFADFARNPQGAARAINTWVERKTEGKIKGIIDRPNPTSKLVLANAIYLKASWENEFIPSATVEEDFWTTGADKTKVLMMHGTFTTGYAENESAQVLELPFKGGKISMLVFLPREREGLAALEDSLNSNSLARWRTLLRPRRVDVTLPRWSSEDKLQLQNTLRAMGMTRSTSPVGANFSAIAPPKAGAPLFIGDVVHQAFIKVTEQGTEAAASTVVEMMGAGMVQQNDRASFVADHPFVYVVAFKGSGTILFLGRLASPSR